MEGPPRLPPSTDRLATARVAWGMPKDTAAFHRAQARLYV